MKEKKKTLKFNHSKQPITCLSSSNNFLMLYYLFIFPNPKSIFVFILVLGPLSFTSEKNKGVLTNGSLYVVMVISDSNFSTPHTRRDFLQLGVLLKDFKQKNFWWGSNILSTETIMECNRDEAVRAKEIAERKFTEREYAGAKKFALKAQNLYPDLEGLSQFLTTLDIYISAENKVSGEVDWYSILGVNPFSDDDMIRKQYRKLALTLHPDKNKSLGAEGAFKMVSEAWSLLSDKAKRLAYNQKRSLNGFQQKTSNHAGSQSSIPNSNGFYSFPNNISSNVRTTKSSTRAGPAAPSPKKANTFWTICNRCRTHYEYLRVYLNHTLLCPNCSEAFLAVEKAPPPSVLKSTNWPSRQQQQSSKPSNSQDNPGRNSIGSQHSELIGSSGPSSLNDTNSQWGPYSKMAGSSSTVSSASAAAQAASVVQQASEKVKRERDGTMSIAEWEKLHMPKRTEGSMHIVDRPSKKSRTDDIHISGYVSTQMGALESRNANYETDRIYGFFGTSTKPSTVRELSMFEIRKILMDKAQREIRKKLEEWRSIFESERVEKEKVNKKQKSMSNGHVRDRKKYGESNVDGRRHRKTDSPDSTSADIKDREKETPMIINVPDPDFYNFDMDRTESSFKEDQVWAAYDDDDGMPRYYARVHKVISLKPFRMRISWLNSRSNSELGPIDWVGSGFTKICGDFRTGKHEITETLNSFSHKVRWTKGNRGVIRIFPGNGEVWALYSNWSPDWNEHTPDDVIHKYDMVEVIDNFNEEDGISVAPLVKVAGFRTVFRRHLDSKDVRRIPKEEMFRFSHRVPNYLLTGQEAHDSPKGCHELDPAATPLELLQVITESNEASPAIGEISTKEKFSIEPEISADEMVQSAKDNCGEKLGENNEQTKDDR